MSNFPLLSIIMPCYNVADTFSRAIDSILMQATNFEYEIIIVNDASTDDSVKLFERYEKEYPFVRILNNSDNSGNAVSFYNGLCNAKGKYFWVLDGDDYYTINDKLQRQIDFLEADVEERYVATSHYYIFAVGSRAYVPAVTKVHEFNYIDFMTSNSGYYHTSTYMYRNIFKGSVPEFFKEQVLRGDSPRTLFHLKYSNKRVKVLNFVGSVYSYTYKGIWTSLDEAKQRQRHIDLYSRLIEMSDCEYEKKAYTIIRDRYSEGNEEENGKYRFIPAYTVDEYVTKIQQLNKTFAFQSEGFMFKSFYYSDYLDSLLETFGYFYRIQHPEMVQRLVHDDRIAIIIGKLIPDGGGIFAEIKELIELYPDKKIEILLTDTDTIEERTLSLLNFNNNVSISCLPQGDESKIDYISRKFVEISPQKAYFYTPHDNPYASVLMHHGPCKNICIFSFDHGYICGISHTAFDCIIAKRPSDYWMLKRRFQSKVVYIPTWGTHKSGKEQSLYKPFNEHGALITACAAARFYKLDGSSELSYEHMIAGLLKRTGGKHYHYGPLSESQMQSIAKALKQYGIPRESFIHIHWADNLSKSLLENHVDIFIEPFPVISYKITLEVLSVGIPIIAYEGRTRISKIDFIYPDYLAWHNKDEFLDILGGIQADTLLDHSKKSLNYFNNTHDIAVVSPYFLKEKQFSTPSCVSLADNTIHEVAEFSRVFRTNFEINFAFSSSAAMNVETAQGPLTNIQKFKKVYREQGLWQAIKKALHKIF